MRLLEPDDEDPYIDIQYSVHDGVLGLDWVLIEEQNIADKDRITRFIAELGHTVAELEMNGVEFLRVENGDLAALGMSIVKDCYQVTNKQSIWFTRLGFLIDSQESHESA